MRNVFWISASYTKRPQAELFHDRFYRTESGASAIRPWPTAGEANVELYDNAYGLDETTVR